MQNNFFVIPPLNDTSNFAFETALVLAKNNLVVLYNHASPISIFRLTSNQKLFQIVKKNLYKVRPLHILPFERFSVIYRLNQKFALFMILFWGVVMRKKDSAIFWLFHPSLIWMVNARNFLFLFKPKFLYDCVDFFSVDYTKSLSKSDGIALLNESEMLKKADLVTANSLTLLQYCRKFRMNVHLVAQGFRLQSFNKNSLAGKMKFTTDKPIVGYAGGINKRLDVQLLTKLVTQNKQWTFIFWGPTQTSIPRKLKKLLAAKNVITGESKKGEIASIIQQFDVAIIPYSKNPFNFHSFPVKLFEYFYCGKPVVSSPINELRHYSKYVAIANTTSEWQSKLTLYTKRSWNKTLAHEQKKIAISHSWKNKIAQTEVALERQL